MTNINIHKIIYHLRHRYLTLNNVVIAIAFAIAASWLIGSLGMMQRNYALQKDLDYKQRQLQLTQLQRDNLKLQRSYFGSSEYQELAVRESLGLVKPGEKALILPKTTATDAPEVKKQVAVATQATNLEQWVNFLFGGYSKSISGQ